MRRRHMTDTAREDGIGTQAPFGEDGGHDGLCPLDRSLRDGRPHLFPIKVTLLSITIVQPETLLHMIRGDD